MRKRESIQRVRGFFDGARKRHQSKHPVHFRTLHSDTKMLTDIKIFTRRYEKRNGDVKLNCAPGEIKDVDDNCFVSSVVITVRSGKAVKIELDLCKLNDCCMNMRPQFPNMKS